MKQFRKKLKLAIALGAICLPVLLMAQPGGFDDDVTDNPVPFDGGVALLVAAALGYGVKKGISKRKQELKQQV